MTRQVLFTGIRMPRLDPSAQRIDLRHTPTIRVAYVPPPDPETAIAWLARRPRVVFPSRSAVEGFSRWLRSLPDPPPLADLEVWAVGEATESAVRSEFRVEPRRPRTPSGAGIAEELALIPGSPVLLVVGDRRRPELPDGLAAHGIEHAEVRVYRTEIEDSPVVRESFRNAPDDWIVFTSPSTVEGFLVSTRRASLEAVRSRLASIGPTTSREIVARGGHVALEASKPDAGALLDDVVRHALGRSG